MKIDHHAILPCPQTAKAFKGTLKTANEKGGVVLLENNKPAYIVLPFDKASAELDMADVLKRLCRLIAETDF